MEVSTKENEELGWAKVRLSRELEKLKDELKDLHGNLDAAETDRTSALDEMKLVRQHLLRSKEAEVSYLLRRYYVRIPIWGF